ncbi:hypothetical protein AXG93_2175s1130 [Marchantia polymorpha subsp. ruderalis]|uniref:Uncharacterized protein n=1 Tax=Marchantia polymorpha subsp. ruderalis TaxID=1480154 RepID=A0A176W621_MARPO|nr:hypothetical protein AXG93_2175s1130 [Marchantia polymorpha subsp. ruderalis]
MTSAAHPERARRFRIHPVRAAYYIANVAQRLRESAAFYCAAFGQLNLVLQARPLAESDSAFSACLPTSRAAVMVYSLTRPMRAPDWQRKGHARRDRGRAAAFDESVLWSQGWMKRRGWGWGWVTLSSVGALGSLISDPLCAFQRVGPTATRSVPHSQGACRQESTTFLGLWPSDHATPFRKLRPVESDVRRVAHLMSQPTA